MGFKAILEIENLTWFWNISLDLHPLVCGHSLLRLGGVIPVPGQVVRGPQLAEVVRVQPVLAPVRHAVQVGVEGTGLRGQAALAVVRHLA